MEPIINPWILYIIELIGNIRIALFFVFVGFLCYFILSFIKKEVYLEDLERRNNKEEEIENIKTEISKISKQMPLTLLIITILISVLPTKETMYKMLIFKNITKNNLTIAEDKFKESVDYIFNKFNEAKDERE